MVTLLARIGMVSLGLVLSASALLLMLPGAYLVAYHLRHARRELARERAAVRIRAEAIAADAMPHVSVQLPVYNEPANVAAAIDAACRMDWPRDRLDVLVLDDSTDATSTIAAERAAKWREDGVCIAHVVRSQRSGYKAGALQGALQLTDAEFIAVFDVDYRPHRTFLRETVGTLAAEPSAAFVQARIDHSNRDANALTRAQALQLDHFIAFEQAACHWLGVPITFNGTSGVWRRRALDQAGGWNARSLVEDQEVSLRAFASGWSCINLVSVTVPGELPETFGALVVQRHRWQTGSTQTFRDLPWRLVRYLSPAQAIVFGLTTAYWATFPMFVASSAAIAVAVSIMDIASSGRVWLGLAAVVFFHLMLRAAGSIAVARLLGRPVNFAFLRDIVGVCLLDLALAAVAGQSVAQGLFGKAIPFARTPKRSS